MYRKRHWWQDYNWEVPFIIINDICADMWKKFKRFCKHHIKLVSFFAICIILSGIIPVGTDIVVASFESHQKLKMQMAQELKQRELSIERQIRQDEYNKQKNAEYQKLLQQKELDELCDELNQNYGIGDRIIITWWEDGSSGTNPPMNTNTCGRITKIVKNKVYGSWGEQPLTFKKTLFHKVGAKEYNEYKRKEDRQISKNLGKTKKWLKTATEAEKRIMGYE